MNKCGCIYIISLIVAVFVLYQQVTHTHASDVTCTWSIWSPWNCSCCTEYYNIPTIRVRMKCCSNTKECPHVPITAKRIDHTDDDHEINNDCEKQCSKPYQLPNSCRSVGPDKISLSCQNTCIGFVSGNGSAKIPLTTSSVTNQSANTFTPRLQLQNNLTNTSNDTSDGGASTSSTFSGLCLLPGVIILGLFIQ